MENKLVYENVEFDKESKIFTILSGSVGTYSYTEIASCKVLNENASYTNSEEPFTHSIIAMPLQVDTIFPKKVYV